MLYGGRHQAARWRAALRYLESPHRPASGHARSRGASCEMAGASVVPPPANACFPFAAHSSRAMVALELVSHPEQRAKNGGAIIAGQIHDTSLDDEASEFNEMPRALAALDLTGAHIMPRPCCLLTVARRPVAP